MIYLTIQRGTIVRHTRDRDRNDLEQPLPTVVLRCEGCGWTAKGIDPKSGEAESLDRPFNCICRGSLVEAPAKKAKVLAMPKKAKT